MGDPKNPRRAWKKPKRPLNYDLKMEELKTLGTFGLKTKRELWKAHTELSRLRHQARSLLALRQEVRETKEPILMQSLSKVGLVEENSTLDDVLNLQVTDLLSRRLQTVVQKKFSFKTPYQSRQAVVHGHIMIGDRIVSVPSYVVGTIEEKDVHLAPDSTLKDLLEKQQKEQPSQESLGTEATDEIKVETSEAPKVEAPEAPKVEAPEQPKEQSPAEEPKVESSSTEKPQD
jgi:small subunit ribosomal protein S4